MRTPKETTDKQPLFNWSLEQCYLSKVEMHRHIMITRLCLLLLQLFMVGSYYDPVEQNSATSCSKKIEFHKIKTYSNSGIMPFYTLMSSSQWQGKKETKRSWVTKRENIKF